MSHFTVAVFTHENDGVYWESQVEALLAPFQENNMGDCPKKYLEFNDMTDEIVAGWDAEETVTGAFHDGQWYFRHDRKFRELGLTEQEVSVKKVYAFFENYAEKYHGYEKDEETGRYGYFENPNRKWDWWQIGGRWAGLLRVKSQEALELAELGSPGLGGFDEGLTPLNVSSALLKDLDLDGMLEDARQKREKVWDVDRHKYPEHLQEMIFGIKPDDTREGYIAGAKGFTTFAALTPDGVWHESGSMGWWGIVSDENANWPDVFAAILAKMQESPDVRITIVDAHI